MAPPNTFKMGPLVNGVFPSKWYVLLVLFNMWISAIPVAIFAYVYIGLLFDWNPMHVIFMNFILGIINLLGVWARIVSWLLFPFALLVGLYIYAFLGIKVAKACLAIETWRHPVREGTFPRDFSNPDYYHFHARRVLKKFPVWVLGVVPFPWMKRSYVYNQLGATIGKDVGLLDSWTDAELVTIESGALLGRATVITSHAFVENMLVLRRTCVKKGAIVGERVRVLPGATIGEMATIAAKSVIRFGEQVPDGATFAGNPAEIM
jgi:acetyltransferase-like isoleucine patch superfamily enzyme